MNVSDSKARLTYSQAESLAYLTALMISGSDKSAIPIYQRIKDAFGNASDVEIARELQTTKSAVSQWKKGKTKPSDSTLLKVAELTRRPIKWLQTGDKKYLASEDEEPQKTSAGPMTLNRFIEELKFLGVEDFNPSKSMKGLTSTDMEEILEVARANAKMTVTTMVEQKTKGKRDK